MHRFAPLALPPLFFTLACGGMGAPGMEGIWCQTDSAYCYEFRGDVVTEDLGPDRRASGTWEIQDDLLLLHYDNPTQTITWQIEKHTADAIILADHQSDETFIMNKMQSMPPVSDRPR